MRQLKHDIQAREQLNSVNTGDDANELAYVRVDIDGRIIAIFNDDTEIDVSELFGTTIANS